MSLKQRLKVFTTTKLFFSLEPCYLVHLPDFWLTESAENGPCKSYLFHFFLDGFW